MSEARHVRPHIAAAFAAATTLLLAACAGTGSAPPDESRTVRVSILGTNDVHGRLAASEGHGGLVTYSGYVNALRASGTTDAVLLVDAGDMWQGTLESNLDEGASVVAAFNALGVGAAAVGNHEFDFGPEGAATIPASPDDDPRGALRARAGEAAFPLLAANLVLADSGHPPAWDNVRPSVIVETAGIRIGIVGIVTTEVLATTIASNVSDLQVTPLADAVVREARRLRADGADLVVVAAHAGGYCERFEQPTDLSSCDPDSEIFALARALPAGLVDHIIGGHKHNGIAHVVNGTPITSSYSSTRAFGRVDFDIDRASGDVRNVQVYPPQPLCPFVFVNDGSCAWLNPGGPGVRRATYAGRPVRPDPAVEAVAERAVAAAAALQNRSLGVVLTTPFTLKGGPDSALGNLVTEALRETLDADIAILNVLGGLRATLPAGELTFGAVYQASPFDNRTVILELSGAELAEVFAAQVRKPHRRAGFAGARVTATCDGDDMRIDILRDDGQMVQPTDRLRVVVNDFLLLGGDGILDPVLPRPDAAIDDRLPRTRDALVHWLEQQDRLRPEDFDGGAPRYRVSPGCTADG